MSRWIRFLVAIAVGVGLGLLYGWVINPVEYVDTSPGTLKFDYKTDYVLMVAESYHADADLSKAALRLALLQEMPLSDLVQKALLFAQKVGYADNDLAILQDLSRAVSAYDHSVETLPASGITTPASPSSLPETQAP
jgi:hypothetical protein